MAYTNVWDDSKPTGSEAANTIDDIFRSVKVDLEQRFIDLFNMANFTADPLRPGGLKFYDTADAKLFFGDNAGTPRGILLRNKADSLTYAQWLYTGITLSPPALTVGSTPFLNVTQTWNNVATTFVGILVNITNTNSSVNSLFFDYQVGGVSQWKVSRAGVGTLVGVLTAGGFVGGLTGSVIGTTISASTSLAIASTTKLYLDGIAASGDSYIWESSANNVIHVVGGVNNLTLTATTAVFSSIAVSGITTFVTSSNITSGGYVIFNTNVTPVDGSIGKTSNIGINLQGATASVYDFCLTRPGGVLVFGVTTGTSNIIFNGGLSSITSLAGTGVVSGFSTIALGAASGSVGWFVAPNTKGLLVANNVGSNKVAIQLDGSNVWQFGDGLASNFNANVTIQNNVTAKRDGTGVFTTGAYLGIADSLGNNTCAWQLNATNGMDGWVASTRVITLTASGIAVPGQYDSTTTGAFILSHGVSTAARYVQIGNSGTTGFFGITDSTGATLITGGTAYDIVIRGTSGIAFSANDGVSTSMRIASTHAVTFFSSTSVPATSKIFVDGGGDTYLIETSANVLDIFAGGSQIMRLAPTSFSFYGHTTVSQQTISGSRGGNAALASLLTALAATGIVVDGTSA